MAGAGVQTGAQGSYVYVVNADNTVSMRSVVTGPTAGDLISITKGLTAGQTVVIDGADQLRDGAKVVVPQGSAVAGASGGAARAHRDGSGGAYSGQHRQRSSGSSGSDSGATQGGTGRSGAAPSGGNPAP